MLAESILRLQSLFLVLCSTLVLINETAHQDINTHIKNTQIQWVLEVLSAKLPTTFYSYHPESVIIVSSFNILNLLFYPFSVVPFLLHFGEEAPKGGYSNHAVLCVWHPDTQHFEVSTCSPPSPEPPIFLNMRSSRSFVSSQEELGQAIHFYLNRGRCCSVMSHFFL